MRLSMRNLSGLILIFAAVAVVSYLLLSYLVLVELKPLAGGLQHFDMRLFGYSEQEANTYFQALTLEGHALFYGPVWLLDTIFPISFTGFLILVSLRYGRGVLLWVGVLLAVLYCGFDLGENWSTRQVLNRAMRVDPTQVALASALTISKFATVFLAILVAFLNWRSGRLR